MKKLYSWANWYGNAIALSKYYAILSHTMFPAFMRGFLLKRNSLSFFVSQLTFYQLIAILKYSSIFYTSSLLDLAVADYPKRLRNRFELTYVFWNNVFNFRFYVKLFTGASTPVLSLSSLYASSPWLEREAWDMFGVKFLFHKDLRRILTDYGFQGYPLRKEYPLMGFSELRYDDVYQSIFVEPVEATQKFRFFKFESPWTSWQ